MPETGNMHSLACSSIARIAEPVKEMQKIPRMPLTLVHIEVSSPAWDL